MLSGDGGERVEGALRRVVRRDVGAAATADIGRDRGRAHHDGATGQVAMAERQRAVVLQQGGALLGDGLCDGEGDRPQAFEVRSRRDVRGVRRRVEVGAVLGAFEQAGVVLLGQDREHGVVDGGLPLGSEAMTFVDQVYQRADALLFGRRTYELFAGYWGVRDDLENPIVGALNTRPKYVASTTLTDPKWADTTVLSGDLAAAISELKAKPGGELQVHGSSNLTRWLLENDLVDEITLLVCPVVVGQGTRLFPDSGPDTALDLVE